MPLEECCIAKLLTQLDDGLCSIIVSLCSPDSIKSYKLHMLRLIGLNIENL